MIAAISQLSSRATGALVIDIGRIAANWRALAARVAPAECAAVVKADAYGLGATNVIPALTAAGCRTFFVATPEEAEQARRLAPEAVVYVLDGMLDAAFLAVLGARPVIGDARELDAWLQHNRSSGSPLTAALQIETGLNRRGVDTEEVAHKLAIGAPLSLVMSHLACGDDPACAMNERQRLAFDRSRALLPAAPASLAASDGLMLGPAYHYDLVRPGYALYGGQAFRGGRAQVEPVVAAFARILQVRDVAAGESVGYSATWTSKGTRRIATIAAGYADGVFRHASGSDARDGGRIAIGGMLCPIVGRVSMDLITADVTACTQADLARAGGFAELIGPHLSLEQVGAQAGTIGYEVLTRLGRRFHRVYVGA
jgi:alanine racemase